MQQGTWKETLKQPSLTSVTTTLATKTFSSLKTNMVTMWASVESTDGLERQDFEYCDKDFFLSHFEKFQASLLHQIITSFLDKYFSETTGKQNLGWH